MVAGTRPALAPTAVGPRGCAANGMMLASAPTAGRLGELSGLKHKSCARADGRRAEVRGGKRNSVRAVMWGGDVDSACARADGRVVLMRGSQGNGGDSSADGRGDGEWRGRQSRGGKARGRERRGGC